MGAGPVLLMPPGGTTSLEWYLRDTAAHEIFCRRLAEHRTLVMYDRHGVGLSDRKRTDFTEEDDMVDIEAVVDALGRPKIDLFGISWGGTPSLAYTARHPDGVRRTVLYGCFATGRLQPDAEFQAREAALSALWRTDRALYAKTKASQFFPGGTDRETFQSLARMLFDCVTPEVQEQLADPGGYLDNQSELSGISTPTLVIHRRGDQVVPFSWGHYMARRLANAIFVPLEGDAHFPWVDDSESVLRPTIEFLTEGEGL